MSDSELLSRAPSREMREKRGLPSMMVIGLAVILVAIISVSAVAVVGGRGSEGSTKASSMGPRETLEYLEQASEKALSSAGSFTPAAKSVALNAEGDALPADRIGEAAAMYTSFGEATDHSWRVYLGTGSDAPTSGPQCWEGPGLLSCDLSEVNGNTVVTTVLAFELVPESGGMYALASDKALAEADLDQMRIERNVRAFSPDGTMVSATERVISPASLDANRAFETPIEAMTALVTDKALVAP